MDRKKERLAIGKSSYHALAYLRTMIRCSHVDSSQQQMTAEQEQVFLGGRLPDDLDVTVCKACFDQFKKNSERVKFWAWGGRVTLVRITKPSPIAKQPLDDILA